MSFDFAAARRAAEQQKLIDEMTTGKSMDATFREEPVDLTTFITDKRFMGNPKLSPIQFDAVRHAERIYFPATYDLLAREAEDAALRAYWTEPIRMTNLLTMQWGKGGGKDHTCRMATLRIAYLLLCLESPQTYFGMPVSDTIHMLNIASNSQQALNAFFKPMTKTVRHGWFKDKSEPKMDTIIFENGVESISGHSDAESQEGLNLILGIADEIDAFRTNTEIERYRGKSARDSARSSQTILDMIRTSASTRFPETYKNIRISYPRYLGSTIQVLTEKGKASIAADPVGSRHYVSGPFSTWAVNPRVAGPKAFKDDYDEDPAMAAAKYECKPTRAIDAYFKDMEAFRNAVVEPKQPVEIRYDRVTRAGLAGRLVETWDATFRFDPGFQAIQGAIYAIHFDMAVSGDRAGAAMSHVMRYEAEPRLVDDGMGGVSALVIQKPVVKNDFCFAFESSKEAPAREIQIRWARSLVLQLHERGFVIGMVTYDGFQSVDSIQLLESWGIETDRLSADSTDMVWKNLRDLVYDSRFQMPMNTLLIMELESLGRFGKKVDHPIGGSKDLSDALACSAHSAVLLGGREDEDGAINYAGAADFELSGSPSMPGAPEHMSAFDAPLGTFGGF